MRFTKRHRWGLVVVAVLCGLPVMFAVGAPPKTEDFTGKVVPLASVLGKLGTKLDEDAAPHLMVLVQENGKALPLIKDAGCRMFFKDERLLNRPMRLTGRVVPEVGMLQVVQVHSIRDGKVCDLYYWCDVCSIRRLEKNACDCCYGPMELREDPLSK